MPAIVALIAQILPLVIQAGMDLAPFVERLLQIKDAQNPTDEDWKFLHDTEAALRAKLNTPAA